MHRFFLALALVFSFLLPHSVATAQDRWNVFFIGHSLMSDLPGMTKSLVESRRPQRMGLRHQDIPGAHLRWQWEAPGRDETFERTYGGRYDLHLTSGDFDTLVLTEGVPRGGDAEEAQTIEYLGRFLDFARRHRPDIRVYYYETWAHLTSGTPQSSPDDVHSPNRHLTWRPRIDEDAKMWARIVKTVNERHPGAHPVRIIPGGPVLAAVSDSIQSGELTEWKSIDQLFSGDIHLNQYGKYIMALTLYAAITGQATSGLPSDIRDLWGRRLWNQKTWYDRIYRPMRKETVEQVQAIVDRVTVDRRR
jgi:hypothetical protein